jgi:hypothetical protein
LLLPPQRQRYDGALGAVKANLPGKFARQVLQDEANQDTHDSCAHHSCRPKSYSQGGRNINGGA